MDILKIFHDMDGFSTAIVGTLLLFAVASSAVLIERLWVSFRASRKNAAFLPVAADALERGRFRELVMLADAHKGSPFAWLLGEGARAYVAAVDVPGQLSIAERVRRDMERKLDAVSASLRRGLGILASVGSVAPFVGLLGTVVGIIASFQSIAKEGSGGLGVVSAGISEALVVTALGLVVAIPSVLIFNMLSARADATMLELERCQGEFLDHVEHVHGEASEGAKSRADVRVA
jgi:biopolymer transport protein ExbB